MTDAMIRLFNDKTRCQKMGEAGRSHIKLTIILKDILVS